MPAPLISLRISLCLVVGITVSLVCGQTPSRIQLGPAMDVKDTTFPITDVGQGGGVSSPLNCFPANMNDAIVWWFPGRTTMVPMETNFPTNPTTITSFRQPTALSLLRSSTIRSPTGEYCCALQSDINQRICVTLQSDCTSVPLSNGMVEGTGTVLENQMTSYSCNQGYVKSESAPDITCGTNSQWTPSDVCNPVDCGPLTNPASGQVMTSGTLLNSVATYSCNIGYNLVGLATRTCLLTGLWSSNLPTCQIVDCGTLAVTNGQVSFPSGTVYNSMATYICDGGYHLNGATTRTCQSNGQWSSSPLTCERICSEVLSLADGVITYNPNTTPRVEGTTATHICSVGFEPTTGPGSPVRTCQASNGMWSGLEVTCVVVNCGALPSITNGQVTFSSGTVYNSMATYSCDSGYHLIGDTTRTCLSTGQWTSSPPTCVLSCPDLSVDNGEVSYSSSTTPRPAGILATFICDMGYTRVGDATRTCTTTAWSGTTPTCPPVDCGQLNIANGQIMTPTGTTFEAIATYSCATGHNLNGAMTSTCSSSGEWTPMAPTCDPVDCGSLAVNNGQVTTSGTTFNNIATYSCNDGYNLNGAMTRTCAANGNWTLAEPTCDPVDCGPPETITNGQVDTSLGTTFTQIATYSCNVGYILSGSAIRVCGSNRLWTFMEPSCIALTAEVVPPGNPPAAGQSYSLMCTVTGADSLNPIINYQWFKTTPNRTQVGTNSPTLTFDPLVLSHAGWYNCEVTLVLTQDVTVVSSDYEVQFTSLNIQFRFNGVPDCGQYTLLDPNLKTHDITTGLVQGVESLCGCGFTTTFISSPSLQCFDDSPQHMTYRAVLTETNNATTVQLVSYIKQWIASTQSLVVQSVRLGINTTCPVVIIDFNSPECPQAIDVPSTSPPPTDPLPGDIGAIIGGVVAGVFVLVVIVAAVIVIVLVGVRYRKTGSKDVQNNTRKVESQAVVLSEINQPSLPDPAHPQPYKTVSTESHEYEDLGKFQEGDNYEQVGHPSGPPKGNYDFTSCPAYAPPTAMPAGRGKTTPTGDGP